MKRVSKGFTLIEVMIVVAIVAIVATIAYPSYQRYVQQSYRAQAQADLMEIAQFMERQYTIANAYPSDPDVPATSPDSGTTRYLITLTASDDAFTLSAVPDGPQTGDRCGTMTLDNRNNRTPVDNNCW